MDSLWTRAIWGLLLVQLSLAQIELNLTCRYAGVYHVEKNGRYSISRTEAPDLCKAFNSTLPTLEQMERALSIGFETCRYGFIEGHVVIPRKTPRFLCAANNTGVYILASNTSLYDTYCFNASAPLDAEDCSSVSDIPSVFEGQVTIGIVNPDGTRYTKKGEYRTNPDDINFNYNQDDDVSSGSAGERSTMGSSTIIQTSYPDVMTTSFNGLRNDDFETSSPAVTKTHSIPETTAQEQHNWMWSWFVQSPPKTEYLTTAKPALTSSSGTTHKTTAVGQEDSDWFSQWLWPSKRERQLYTTTRTVGMDSTTTSERLQPTEEREDETEKFPSYSGSGIDDDEDFVNHDHSSTTSATTRATSEETIGNQDWQNWEHGPQNPEEQPQATTEVTAIVDMTRSDDRSYGENSTKESQHPLIFDGNHEDYDGHHSSSTTQDRYSRHETTSQSQDDSWIDYLDPISHPMEPYNPTRRNMDTAPHHSTADPNEGWIEDYGTTEQSPMATQQNHPESTSRPRTGLEDGHEHSTAPSPTSFTDGETDGNFPEDSTTPVEDSISNFPDTNENTTHSSGAHMPTELPGMTEPTVSGGFASDNSGPDDSYPHRPRRPAVTGYSTPFPEGNQGQSGQTTDNRPRKAQIPGMFQLGKGRASDGETPQISVLMNDQRDQKENGHQGSFLLPFQSTEEGSKVDFIRAEQPNSSPLSHG
ncbi:CD44 antigen isoform X2 [Monodelphis domestica]|uniref:CD44 antigen isoform X2 n=1 Tax=Monodelphis domestica TaxID=13616 RepID=UPI0024E1DB3D|nr:CD44 antigen isoform X2 [Monodelphis domestica]